ncbi:hypothetical protein AK812_SmicGene22533, partial [Symbiodinium microadriaticum]
MSSVFLQNADLNRKFDLQGWAILSRRPFITMDGQTASLQSCSLFSPCAVYASHGLQRCVWALLGGNFDPCIPIVLVLGFQLLSWAFLQPSAVRRRPWHVLRRSQGEEVDPVDTVEADADE